MKAHIGVDSRMKLIHSVAATVNDSCLLPELLHGIETAQRGDSAHQAKRQVIRSLAPQARDMTQRRYNRGGWLDPVERRKNRTKSGAGRRG